MNAFPHGSKLSELPKDTRGAPFAECRRDTRSKLSTNRDSFVNVKTAPATMPKSRNRRNPQKLLPAKRPRGELEAADHEGLPALSEDREVQMSQSKS